MLGALLRHTREGLRNCWTRGCAPLIDLSAASRPLGLQPAATFGSRPHPSGTGWGEERKYPFKPPLRRVRKGGKWMERPPAAAAGGRRPAALHWGRKKAARRRRDAQPRMELWDGGYALLGYRLPRPNMAQLGRARAARAAAAAAAPSNVTRQDVWEETALSHNTGMQLVFLGTGTGGPGEARRAGAMALKTLRSIWLFDCGEDTQRQVHRQPLIRHGRVDRVFLTNARLTNLLGMLCTMSAAREIGLDVTDMPLHLYGPPGLAEFIRPLLQLSDTYISMPVLMHELVEHAVPGAGGGKPECLDRRSCLYRVRVPPDALNPEGWYDGTIAPFLDRARARTRVLLKGADERANLRELLLPPPGDPAADISRRPDALRWTIRCERDQLVTAVRVPAAVPSWAYICTEADRVGRLHVERCQELRVPPGSAYSALKNGRSVRSETGELVTPEQVIGPDIPGRKLVVVGEASDSMPLLEVARGADAIVHAATYEVAAADGTSRAVHALEQAAAFAAAAEAKHLLLYRFAPGSPGAQAAPAESGSEAREAQAAEDCLDQLNPLNAYEYERRRLPGGHLCQARGHLRPAEAPPQAVAAVKARVEALLGRPGSASLAEDMALYAVDRRLPPGEAEQQQLQDDGSAGGRRQATAMA